jgi:hypothetical protein
MKQLTCLIPRSHIRIQRIGFAIAGMIAACLLLLNMPHAAHAQTGPAGDDLTDKGIVTAMPSGMLFGAWTINGNNYIAQSGATEFRQDNGALAVNGCAEVKYVIQSGQRIALRISSDDSCGGVTTENETLGLIVSRPSGTNFGAWQIGNATYQAISGSTTFREFNGALAAGVCAEVKWILPTTALRISSKQLHDCAGVGDDNEATGVIQSLPASGSIGIWQIGGLSYSVTPSTTLRNGPFAVGAIVEVHFTRATSGTLIATDIERKARVEDDLASAKLYGRIESRPAAPATVGAWVIAGNTLSVTNSTLLSGTLAVGQCVEAHYHLAGSVKVADRIKPEGDDDCPAGVNGPISRAFGFVEAKPVGGLVGEWKIAGVTYSATLGTQFSERQGALIVGAFVKVSYVMVAGAHTAVEIETEDAPNSGDDFIGELRINGNQWTVNGRTFIVDDSTLFDDRAAEVRDGASVRVNIRQSPALAASSAQATFVATKVTGLTAIQRVLLPAVLR